MIVCHCKAVTDRQIKDAARRGARSCRDVANGCLAGSRCGGCVPLIEAMLKRVQRSRDSGSRVPRG